MSDPAQFENALDRLASALKDVFRELRVEIPAPASVAAPVVVAAPAPPPEPIVIHVPTPVGPGTAPLCSGFEGILTAANQADIMQALLDGTASYAGRSAVLVVKGDRLAGWRGRGFNEPGLAGLRGLNLAADGDAGWRDSLSTDGPLAKSVADGFARNLGPSAEGGAYLIPLSVRDRAVAVLYADGGADAPALRLLTRTAGIRLEMLSGGGVAVRPAAPAATQSFKPAPVAAPTPVPAAPAAPAPAAPSAPARPAAVSPAATGPVPKVSAPTVTAPAPTVTAPTPAAPAPAAPAPAPAPRKVAGPDLTNIPADEQDAHKKAFRFAKLLVDELMLYNKDKVATGKQQKDVYALLHEDIDKSRLAYEKKFAATPAAKVDYFHQQMVQQIGDGDPAAIGNGYPGSLV